MLTIVSPCRRLSRHKYAKFLQNLNIKIYAKLGDTDMSGVLLVISL